MSCFFLTQSVVTEPNTVVSKPTQAHKRSTDSLHTSLHKVFRGTQTCPGRLYLITCQWYRRRYMKTLSLTDSRSHHITLRWRTERYQIYNKQKMCSAQYVSWQRGTACIRCCALWRDAARLLLSAKQQPIDIFCSPGPQQWSAAGEWDRQTDRRKPNHRPWSAY